MDLSSYFDQTDGLGVLSTADKNGKVDIALYAKPRFFDEKHVLFIMGDRLSHKNLESNPRAAYLFLERGEGYQGKRLFLRKVREEPGAPVVEALRRRVSPPSGTERRSSRSFVVKFKIEKVRPLAGG